MQKITGYDTESSSKLENLTDMVRARLLDGWEPFGNLVYVDGVYIQPMVKYDKKMTSLPR